MITITDKGAEKVREFLESNPQEGEAGLRVGVRGGGCSGFQYVLAFDEKRDGDMTFNSGGTGARPAEGEAPNDDGSAPDRGEPTAEGTR